MKKIGQKQLVRGLILVVLLCIFFFFRPLFHGYVMSVWIDPLGKILRTAGVLALLYAGLSYAAANVRQYAKTGKSAPKGSFNQNRLIVFAVVGVGLLVVSGVWSLIVHDVQLAKAFKTYNFAETKTLPTTAQDRLVPLPVAERFGKDALQRPTERAYVWHSQLWNDKLSWVAPLTPSGLVRTWADKAAGLQIVDASSTERKTEIIDQKFVFSEGVALTDNIRWQLYKKRYFVDLPEVYFGKAGNKVYAIVPILTYKGMLVKYPVLDGAFIVSPDGTIHELSADEAKKHPAVVSSGRLYPEKYIRFVHESYALKNGVFNKWFRHIDQTEISDPTGEDNKQPYMLATDKGLNWLSAADPWGQSFGVYKIFMTDAITGETKLYSTPKDSSWTGASQAIGYIKSAKPQYNWQVENAESGSTSGNILAVEPRPVFVKNQLFWVVSITNTEAKGVNETCFVSAANNQVTCVSGDQKARDFLTNGTIEQTPLPQPAPNNSAIQDRLNKIEQSLRDALQEIETLKARP